tara:strand:+ start:852 stop:1769 length:918 start_codon:yes stop_codon:yes gene_type:complete
MSINHRPIMLQEVINMLVKNNDGIYIDCTLGFAGHSYEILKKISNKGLLIGMDLDPYALNKAKEKLSTLEKKFLLFNMNYKKISTILSKLRIEKVDGFLFDLGISSYQVDSPHRGFSFKKNGPLDMRFNNKKGSTAEELLEGIAEKKLEEIIRIYSDEGRSKSIAKGIIRYRKRKKIKTTFDLKEAINLTIKKPNNKIYSKVFQSIRIALNDEMENLKESLQKAAKYLKPNGRIAVLSFHSIEDRIVKHFFKDSVLINQNDYYLRNNILNEKFNLITKKPITASRLEIKNNKRANSAKLRVAEKI